MVASDPSVKEMLVALMASSARMESMMDGSNKRHDAAEAQLRNQGAAIALLERSVGEISKVLNERKPGCFPLTLNRILLCT